MYLAENSEIEVPVVRSINSDNAGARLKIAGFEENGVMIFAIYLDGKHIGNTDKIQTMFTEAMAYPEFENCELEDIILLADKDQTIMPPAVITVIAGNEYLDAYICRITSETLNKVKELRKLNVPGNVNWKFDVDHNM